MEQYDIHFTHWTSQNHIEVRMRNAQGLKDAPWNQEDSLSMWHWLIWQSGLLQRDLRRPQHANLLLHQIGIRLSYAPMSLGARMVLRIHREDRHTPLPAPWMPPGLSMIYGPTGAGKTLLAYRWLQGLHSKKVIISIEDPPEPVRASWPQFDQSIFRSFEEIHHLVLRQNPDILFWGEVRDGLAWRVIENWVTSGHHVITTMHAASLEQCRDRLKHFGADADFLRHHLIRLQAC